MITLSKGKGTWCILRGKRRANETVVEALMHEVKEELTVNIFPKSVHKYGVFEEQAHGKPEGTIVRMTCYFGEYEGKLTPSSEIETLAFFECSQKSKASPVDHLIFEDLKAKG